MKRKVLNARIAAAISHEFPVGEMVYWERGGHTQSGAVVDHGYGERLKVQNARTSKEVWLSLRDIGVEP